MIRAIALKAGTEMADKAMVQKIIDDGTSGDYKNHIDKKSRSIEAKVVDAKQKLAAQTDTQRMAAQEAADAMIEYIEDKFVFSEKVIHVDNDAFFASVEMRDDPTLRKIPFAVGSMNMLSTANYLARKKGVSSAMPGFLALQLCPNLRIVPVNMEKYKKASCEIRDILLTYDSNLHSPGLDEAVLNLNQHLRTRANVHKMNGFFYGGDCQCSFPIWDEDTQSKYPNAVVEERANCARCNKERITYRVDMSFGPNIEDAVEEMRFIVAQRTGLTCSAGIACNSTLAKICSNEKKPNGQFVLQSNKKAIASYMRELNIRRLSGVGPMTEALLNGLGFSKCGDIIDRRADIVFLFSDNLANSILRSAMGLSAKKDFDLVNSVGKLSISSETSFPTTSNQKVIEKHLVESVENAFESLKQEGYESCQTVLVKVKFHDYMLTTRSRTVAPLLNVKVVRNLAMEIYKQNYKETDRIRLIGVSLAGLTVRKSHEVQKTMESYLKTTSPAALKKEDDDIIFDKQLISPSPIKLTTPKSVKANKKMSVQKGSVVKKGKKKMELPKGQQKLNLWIIRKNDYNKSDDVVVLD
ncbi:DNA polymerase kappa [Aphelenchoides besseyi]|nr:DNA polymerase kappa [Aphelenchoides besseyi]